MTICAMDHLGGVLSVGPEHAENEGAVDQPCALSLKSQTRSPDLTPERYLAMWLELPEPDRDVLSKLTLRFTEANRLKAAGKV